MYMYMYIYISLSLSLSIQTPCKNSKTPASHDPKPTVAATRTQRGFGVARALEPRNLRYL